MRVSPSPWAARVSESASQRRGSKASFPGTRKSFAQLQNAVWNALVRVARPADEPLVTDLPRVAVTGTPDDEAEWMGRVHEASVGPDAVQKGRVAAPVAAQKSVATDEVGAHEEGASRDSFTISL